MQAGKTQDATNSDTSEKVSNGVVAKEINNGDNRPEKENKEQREKRNASNPTHQWVHNICTYIHMRISYFKNYFNYRDSLYQV